VLFLAIGFLDFFFVRTVFFAGAAFFAEAAWAARNAAQRFWLASAIRFLPAALSLRFLPAGLAGAAFRAGAGASSCFR
jgi:hypothetical protein